MITITLFLYTSQTSLVFFCGDHKLNYFIKMSTNMIQYLYSFQEKLS